MSEGQKPTRPLLWEVEFMKLLASIEDSYVKTMHPDKRQRFLRYHTLLSVGGYIGPRAKEFLNLRWIDIVNKTEGDLFQFKQGRQREVFFHQHLIRIIDANYTKLDPENIQHLVLHKKDEPNTPIATRQFNSSFKRLLENANIHTGTPSSHTLRKTFGMHIYADVYGSTEKGLIMASKMLDHRSVEDTMKYIGLTRDKMKETYLKF
ncbi:MAG: tyrosine-type recombinase/integrase [Reichenbachiella sp.]|uniref:tyrosine-type recombinase/integrase n=1 Tax=Reichenbachiella sp. TaxID=2184521 RepID=UPI003298E382